LFQKKDGTIGEDATIDDRVQTGKNSLPVYQGGFGFNLDYKGFFCNTQFTYAMDTWRFDYDMNNLYSTSSVGQFNVSKDMLNAWTPTNTITNIPALYATNYAMEDYSDRFLKDASYIRLRNLQFGYKLSAKSLEKTFFTSATFTLQGENLLTFSKWRGYDAESNRASDFGQYPTPRVYSLGVDLRF